MKYEKYDGGYQVVDLSHMPITEIGAKAFLSCKTVEKIVLPASLEQLGDWAFSHAKNLREIVFPLKDIHLGKQVFLGCDSLEKISFSDGKENRIEEEICYFMASYLRYFDNPRLLAFENLQTEQQKWLENYDNALLECLEKPLDADFKPVFIGWFDVEDIDSQLERHVKTTENRRLVLVLQRLEYETFLTDKMRQELQNYLQKKEAQMINLFLDNMQKYGGNMKYYTLWYRSKGLTGEVAAKLLEANLLSDAEIRAYLLKIQLETADTTDFFDNFMI
ncbi:MAG: leucine-rich repeat domain-containing protein [Lachnospiraceae bacterium]|nr:leucine-rich repeat domain-containing protein [Lachnospiraceae bacterium]